MENVHSITESAARTEGWAKMCSKNMYPRGISQILRGGLWFFRNLCTFPFSFFFRRGGGIQGRLPREEFELTANSLGAHIEIHGGLILRTLS